MIPFLLVKPICDLVFLNLLIIIYDVHVPMSLKNQTLCNDCAAF